ncbi:hypothetical protein [Streptomyces sp. NPDC060194]|uniref:hypothetical protein n=1 Tax=Streptomyces sp. NPDC060194 TaxID=3347069 RepID=UPI003651F2FE
MKPNVSTYRLFGHRDMLRDARTLAPLAAHVVGRAVPGRMPSVQITLTTPQGLAELAVGAEIALTGAVTSRARNRAVTATARQARKSAGRAVPLPGDKVLILLNVRQHRTREDVAVTLVHELTHAMQFSRPGVRERIITDLRDDFGIHPQPRRAAREHARRLRDEEREAYAAEHLAALITDPAALAA